ncbi:MAG: gspD 1 [Phycisphaerales bacterium]|nr:gspD 1 [Phycisphaerales bacterium]
MQCPYAGARKLVGCGSLLRPALPLSLSSGTPGEGRGGGAPTKYSRTLFACAVSALLALVCGAAPSRAAGPERPTVPATQAANVRPGVPASQPAATRPADGPATRPSPGGEFTLNFKDAPIDAVLEYLSEAGGLVVIKEGPFDGRVTVQSQKPVSPEEAVTILGAVLKSSGYSAVQNGRVVKIVAREKAKKGGIPVHFGADPGVIAATEELITQVIPIKNVNATRLKQDLTPLIGTDADVTANEASNTIAITDASVNIRRIAQVIAAMDQQETTATDLRIVRLKHANASITAKLIESIFKSEGGGGQMTPQQQMMMQQQGGGGPPPSAGSSGRPTGGPIDQALRGGHVRAQSDDRTNTLIITAPTDTLKVIDDILKQLDSDPIAESEMKAFHLQFADAEAASKMVNSLLKQSDNNQSMDSPFYFRQFGGMQEQTKGAKIAVTFDARTNSVVVTAPAEVLKSVGDLLKDLDTSPPAAAEMKVYQLKYADAWSTAKLITSTFEPENKDSGSNPFRFIFYGMNPSSGKAPKVIATSDDRTNSLIVTAPKEALTAIEELIKQLDSNPTSDGVLFIYPLRNAQASNLEWVLNVLFGNTQGQQNQQNGGRQPGDNGQPQNFQNGQNQNNGSNRLGSGTGASARRNSRNNSQGNRQNMPRLSQGLAKATTELSGEVFVVADPDTNSLLVTTSSKYKEQVRQIIKELDRPAPQVLIKVLVAEVTHDNSADWGVDFSILNKRANGKGQTIDALLGNAPAAAANGGLVVSVVETNINATLHALATAGKLDVLSRPYILASDNQLASITVGQEVPFVSESRLTDTGQTINTVTREDVGIILDVTPHINPDGLVILDVAPEISQLTGTTVTISSGVDAPVIAKRAAQSRVGIMNGQTIVIGGLMEDRKTSTVSKVPILGDIPWIGELFRRTQVSKSKTELLIFLTPHVAQQPDALKPMSDDEMRGTKLTPHAVEPGTFDDQMRGMRRGASPQIRPADPPSTQPQ